MKTKFKTQTGFTLIELIITIVFIGIVGVIITGAVLNTPGQTEQRAAENAKAWVKSQDIYPKRLSCAHDSDGDGYGSCSVVTIEDEKIYLQCAASYFGTMTGATGCKETEGIYQMQQTRRRVN